MVKEHPFKSPREGGWVWRGGGGQGADVRLSRERGECVSQRWKAVCTETSGPLEGVNLLNV